MSIQIEIHKWPSFDCSNGDLMCGPCKIDLAGRVVKFLEVHQKKRDAVEDIIESCIIRE